MTPFYENEQSLPKCTAPNLDITTYSKNESVELGDFDQNPPLE